MNLNYSSSDLIKKISKFTTSNRIIYYRFFSKLHLKLHQVKISAVGITAGIELAHPVADRRIFLYVLSKYPRPILYRWSKKSLIESQSYELKLKFIGNRITFLFFNVIFHVHIEVGNFHILYFLLTFDNTRAKYVFYCWL